MMNELTEQDPVQKGCMNCGNPAILKDFPNPLCESCREQFIKFPVPLWVKLFAGAVILILLFSLYKIPKNISLGMHLEKAETAMNEKNYLRAEQELQIVLQKIPGDIEMKSNLLIAAFKNGDFFTYSEMLQDLSGQDFKDMALYEKVNNTVEAANTFYPSDDFMKLYNRYDSNFDKIPDTTLQNYTKQNPLEYYPLLLNVNRLTDRKEYAKADTILSRIISIDKTNSSILLAMATIKRLESDYPSSLRYCDMVLDNNHEDVVAISSKARTYLKWKKDREAAQFATQAYSLDPKSEYTIGTMALLYHFSGKTGERNKMIKNLEAFHDTSSSSMLIYVKDVISGKENFRQ